MDLRWQRSCEPGARMDACRFTFQGRVEGTRTQPRSAGAPELCERFALSIQRRAQGRLDAGRTHGPRANKMHGAGTTGTSRTTGLPCAMVLTVSFVLSSVTM